MLRFQTSDLELSIQFANTFLTARRQVWASLSFQLSRSEQNRRAPPRWRFTALSCVSARQDLEIIQTSARQGWRDEVTGGPERRPSDEMVREDLETPLGEGVAKAGEKPAFDRRGKPRVVKKSWKSS
jgi:hypothetical protein